MRTKKHFNFQSIVLTLTLMLIGCLPGFLVQAQATLEVDTSTRIKEKVRQLMTEGDIPGLSLVIVKEGEPDFIEGFGYADQEKKVPVTSDTLFELGSCSKAFTALAALALEEKGLISLDDPVSKYFPGFSPTYRGTPREITIRQLLHHTSGIPWKAISYIPQGRHEQALAQTVKNITKIELNSFPGTRYEYSSVNYAVAGAIIEKAAKMDFETYMVENIFKPLGLTAAIVGVDKENPPPAMAAGYKIGFSKARRYDAPVYPGNNSAAYIISNGKDMAAWLKAQMGAKENPLAHLIRRTQEPDLTVQPDVRHTSYAMGWFVNQYGKKGIFHTGLNPNFSTYISFSPKTRTAVAVMSNSNSAFTDIIGQSVVRMAAGLQPGKFIPPDNIDKATSMVSYFLGFFLLVIIAFFIFMLFQLIKGQRRFEPITLKKIGKMILGAPLITAPFLFGLYLVPKAVSDVTWETALVWSPSSFKVAILLLLAAFALNYAGFIFSTIFPHRNKYIKSIPMLILLGFLTGGANAAIIFLITSSLFTDIKLVYLLYYFVLALTLFIAGRKVMQTKLIRITFDIVYDFRMQLIGKIFLTSYQRLEPIESGRILATLNNDTNQVGNSASLFVNLISSFITVLGVFIYLATVAFWATLVTLFVIAAISGLYLIVSRKSQAYLEDARETQNVFMGLLHGMMAGFRELSLHFSKRMQYKSDLEKSCDLFRNKLGLAMIKFINAFLVGESLLIVVLGAVGFAVPRLFPDISTITLTSFIIALLYLFGPINAILGAIPGIMRLRVAWGRIQGFIRAIPANMDPKKTLAPLVVERSEVQSIKATGLMFQYKGPAPVPRSGFMPMTTDGPVVQMKKTAGPAGPAGPARPGGRMMRVPQGGLRQGDKGFAVGPIDFEAKKGEVVFVVGGNGSGKTTLAKLLTGLYVSEKGTVKINDKEIPNHQLGEYFSVVLDQYYLFKKIYGVDLSKKKEEIEKYLELLEMKGKVELENNEFSTLGVSGGQRKRLALLQCYLEDYPIFLFDELAADQDPVFRRFFYRVLLKKIKEMGKIVIAITHDDHYFDAADKVVKLDMGKVDYVGDGAGLSVTS